MTDDPLLPEHIAEMRRTLGVVISFIDDACRTIPDATAALDPLAKLLPQLLSAAERGIAAGAELEELRGSDKEASEWMEKALAAIGRAAKAEADLAASEERIGEERRKALEEAALEATRFSYGGIGEEIAHRIRAALSPKERTGSLAFSTAGTVGASQVVGDGFLGEDDEP
jgi:hypothetical protein